MACRSLLWIAAVVAVGAAVADPSLAGVEPDAGWTVTVDEPTAEAVVDSKHLVIRGTATNEAGVDGVTVTASPEGLPPACGPATGPATVEDDRYVVELDVGCNGPYRIEVDAEGPAGSATAEPRLVGVAERPPQPGLPVVDVTPEGGLRPTWDAEDAPDATGSILLVDDRQVTFAQGIGEATLPPTDRRAAIAVRTVRWGAGGPGTAIASPESGWVVIAEVTPTVPTDLAVPSEPPDDPAPPPEAARIPPPPEPSATTSPPPPTTTTTVPVVPPTPVATSAVVARDAAPRSGDRAGAATAPVGGVVRTTDDRSSGLAAPLAVRIALALAAVPVLVWLRHRALPPGTAARQPS
ncbi:MAG TPA: hypothetical protein VFU19_17690 [Iamia sp.]|nr:hypothetical protein [Iamia sp.]